MRRLTGLFLLGLAALVPVGLLIYLLSRVLSASERIFAPLLVHWLPEHVYLPGMGVLLTVLLVLFTGVLARSWVGPRIGGWFTGQIIRVPLLGQGYLTLRRLASRLHDRSETSGFQRVVFIADPSGKGRLGLVADERPLRICADESNLVPVYFPAPFQPGGDLVLVPADQIRATELTVDIALGLILTAGLARDDTEK